MLSTAVAIAVVDFLYGPFARISTACASPLRLQLETHWWARRRVYRGVYAVLTTRSWSR
jgi:hypothetical protein